MKVVHWAKTGTDETSGWARILADSINPAGVRLTTVGVIMWRGMLAELNTHRAFSRNSASSRAIPVEKMLARVREIPFVPRRFPINKPGMSATEYVELGTPEYEEARQFWLEARDQAVTTAEHLMSMGIHKQIANRLLEPWMWHSVIISATDWDNFFQLRISEFAQPEIYDVAVAIKQAMDASTPKPLKEGQWHLPLVPPSEARDLGLDAIKASVARCAAVSYNRHDTESTREKEQARFEGLKANRHMSPFEHAARVPGIEGVQYSRDLNRYYGNFRGWQQARWFIENELEIR